MGIKFKVDTNADGRADRTVTPAALVRLIRSHPGRRFRVWRPRAATVAQRIVRACEAQVGVVEHPAGSNRGEQVEAFQHVTTVPGTGWPWCQAFARWVWDQAGVQRGGYRGAYVPDALRWARAAGRYSREPVVGAWVFLDFTGDGVPDHVGVVVRVVDVGVETIEGNTSPDSGGSQANGGGVFRRVRYRSQIVGYCRP